MKTLRLVLPMLLLAAALAPAPAAADETIAADPAAEQITAGGGLIVWVSQTPEGEVLMQRTADGTVSRVPRSPVARFYRSLDIGRTVEGDLVLTYFRCYVGGCVPMRDDLKGNRTRFRTFVLKNCNPTTAPAIWNRYAAYGLSCFKRKGGRRVFDRKRSGLYVRRGSSTPRRVTPPRAARRAGAYDVEQVDLRGNRVAAVFADIYAYAFSAKLNNTDRTSFLAATSEGEGTGRVAGLALGSTPTLWALALSEHAGDPNQSIIYRNTDLCVEVESLRNPPGPHQESGFPAVDIAVDGPTAYLVVPGTGIVRHDYNPQVRCT